MVCLKERKYIYFLILSFIYPPILFFFFCETLDVLQNAHAALFHITGKKSSVKLQRLKIQHSLHAERPFTRHKKTFLHFGHSFSRQQCFVGQKMQTFENVFHSASLKKQYRFCLKFENGDITHICVNGDNFVVCTRKNAKENF